MKGSIYTSQKCFKCGATLKYNEGKGHLRCLDHPDLCWGSNCMVRFGVKHTKRFKTVIDAEKHLTLLRAQVDKGTYDDRYWQKGSPLSFMSLRQKFVKSKQKNQISPKQIRHITYVLEKAGERWDKMSIKEIGEGEIEDFFDFDHGVKNKTLANWKTVLHDFWKWAVRREKRKIGLEMPEFPDIKFELEMKTVVTLEQQAEILEELYNITININPRIWLAARLSTWYPKIRPGEMRSLKESNFKLNNNFIVIPQPKERKPKYVHLLPEHSELIRKIRDMVPTPIKDTFFFRHLKTRSGVKEGEQFGPKYFNKWWKKACNNLGISGVTFYPGVKHSTVTGLGQIMSPEKIQHDVTGHVSDAFKRYLLPDIERSIAATKSLAKMQKDHSDKTIIKKIVNEDDFNVVQKDCTDKVLIKKIARDQISNILKL